MDASAFLFRDRSVLTKREAELRAEYMTEDGEKVEGKQLSKPASWGGFRVVPSAVEFWQVISTPRVLAYFL